MDPRSCTATIADRLQLPGWVMMWSLAIAIYVMLKALTWITREPVEVARWKKLVYLVAWPGMDVNHFLNPDEVPIPTPRLQEWLFAAFKLSFGIVLLVVVGKVPWSLDPYLVGWIDMIGLGFVLHFGLFHILALVWKPCGLNAVPVMDWPIKSESLAEFWGRRWNRAFRDLSHRFVFSPLVHFVGARGALVAGFVVSGLIHDVVISLPAGAGFGCPTTFFAIQAIGILLERSHFGRSVGLGRGIRGRLFSAAFLVIPVGLLFHHPFVCNIIVPFVQALRNMP